MKSAGGNFPPFKSKKIITCCKLKKMMFQSTYSYILIESAKRHQKLNRLAKKRREKILYRKRQGTKRIVESELYSRVSYKFQTCFYSNGTIILTLYIPIKPGFNIFLKYFLMLLLIGYYDVIFYPLRGVSDCLVCHIQVY